MSDNEDEIYANSDSDPDSDKSDAESEAEEEEQEEPFIGVVGEDDEEELGIVDDEEPDDDEEQEDDEEDDDDQVEDDDDDEDNYQEGGANDENLVVGKKKRKGISKPVLIDSDDDEDDMEENYLQKFDKEISKNYVKDFHPECVIHNYDEIACLTKVVRDNDNIIIDPLHRTLPFLTKYERARILGQRSKQIEAGAKPFISVPENIIEGNVIAELELQQKKIPFIIRRPLPSGGFEYWNIQDLEVISF